MRRRSGALHCETQQQLLELASHSQMGLYYNDGPSFKQVKFQEEWTMTSAQNSSTQDYDQFDYNEQQTEAKEQQKQLNRGKRYLDNCVVDTDIIRCSIQICIVTQKIEQVIAKMVKDDSLLSLFIHTKETAQNCIYKHSAISSSPNSNVFCLDTKDVEIHRHHTDKENIRLTPKNWLKNGKNDKMMELLIVKKHIWISQNSQIGQKRISIIHRIFIINQKYLQNPLIKIYLTKSHFVVDTRGETFKPHNDSENKSNRSSLYSKLFNHKSFFDRDCAIFNRGEFNASTEVSGQQTKFRFAFHKIEERIAKNYMRKLNEMLVQQKRKSIQKSRKTNRTP